MSNKFRFLTALFLILTALPLASGCSQDPEGDPHHTLNPQKFGSFPGSISEIVTKREYPEGEILYFPALSDLILALKTEKIDGFVLDKAFYHGISWETAGLSYIDEPLETSDYAYCFTDNETGLLLKSQMDAFITALTESGELARLQEKWFSSDEPEQPVDLSGLTGENGTVRLAVGTDNKPFLYRKDSGFSGYEMELAVMFAEEYGYSLDVSEVNFDGLLAGVEVGRFDMGAFALIPTAERKENLLFSQPSFTGEMVLIVREQEQAPGAKKTLKDLEYATLAVVTGSSWDIVAQTRFPDAPRKYFNSTADTILALSQGKADALFTDVPIYASMRWDNNPVIALEEPVATVSNGLAFPKEGYNETLLSQINDFIAQSRSDGTLDALADKWFGDSEPLEHPDYSGLTGENGTVRVALADAMRPNAYQRGTGYTGYEVDFLTLFAQAYGYRLEFEGMSFHALIPTVSSGKCDMGACGLTITPEREESVKFSDPHFVTDGVAVVYHDWSEGSTDIWAELKDAFEKTFLREDRWKLIAQGTGVTMLISLSAAVGGSLLGFGLYMLTRCGRRAVEKTAKWVAQIYSRIIAGTPVVVILMILFYVVFGNVRNISGIAVSITGFSLTFGAFVYSHMNVAVDSVDRGQREAASALGYPRSKAFFRIVLPQAMTIFLPTYCAQAVELIKATAVVGYIAVNDLTKMGDIIRSNTYEAFFPLIATAVIYFLLTWALSLLLGRVQAHFHPKQRSSADILRGRPFRR